MNKFVQPRPFADPEAAARKLLELAHAFEPMQDGRIFIKAINAPMLFELKATPAEYKAGLNSPSSAAGWCCTRAGRSSGLLTLARRCLREQRQLVDRRRQAPHDREAELSGRASAHEDFGE